MKQFSTRVRLGLALLGVVVLLVGMGIGALVTSGFGRGSALAMCEESLIDPVRCSGEGTQHVSYLAFRNDLADHLAAAQANGSVTTAGVYFRDLRNGPTLSLNANDAFFPMSLMKMPLMVAILKYAETHPGALEEKIHTPANFAENVQVMEKAETLLPDKDYTVEEAITFLISYSDNHALLVLSQWLDERAGRDAVIDTLVNLGLMRRQDTLPSSTVSPRTYAEILRILYSAAYLNPEYSQKALAFLTHTKFKDGISHNVGEDVRVAHKFGVQDDGDGKVQLHDCGIVYHPAGPYILCVMTQGSDYQKQARYIQDVAERVYDLVTVESQQ